MAVPKKRRSKSKKRSHGAQWKIETPQLNACTNCGAAVPTHQACAACGFYKGKQVYPIKVKQPKETQE